MLGDDGKEAGASLPASRRLASSCTRLCILDAAALSVLSGVEDEDVLGRSLTVSLILHNEFAREAADGIVACVNSMWLRV